MSNKKQRFTSCDTCVNNVYDDEAECYVCEVDLDEDEIYRLFNEPHYACPYYRSDDDYAIVRKQN
ncbi:DUF6472 family protein [uncultured Ruminococcus sp.]|uniref:DUF6472 family protein n=1 Tax=uncultured Ruminococcus sp. TaxID=165186 RepID=UPI0025DFA9C8|nr:DUF6472 family protein [uncultured Ruminococcus sp.]